MHMHIHWQATLSIALATTVFLTACSGTPMATPVAMVVAAPLAPYLNPKNPLYKERSVYFDFDQSVVQPGATPLLELHGKYLAGHPQVVIKIEGNTDQQGGAEYNLALGQKRSEAVLKALKIGVLILPTRRSSSRPSMKAASQESIS